MKNLLRTLPIITGLLIGGHAQSTERSTIPDAKKATVVIQFDDQDLIGREISFTSPISGFQALTATGLKVLSIETDFGPAVCSIEGVGCPANNCFCGGNQFWNYSHWDDKQWQSYQVGAGSSVIKEDGSIEGWRWGAWGGTALDPRPINAAIKAEKWLRAQQQGDGGYGSPSASSEAMLVVGANKINPALWKKAKNSLLRYWSLGEATPAQQFAKTSAAANAKLLLAAISTGQNPRLFGGVDLVTQLKTFYHENTGAFGTSNWDQALSMLAWHAAHATVPQEAATQLLEKRVNADKGWGFRPGSDSDTNSTALMVQALIAGGECPDSPVIVNALEYLKKAQNKDGGFPFSPGGASDTNSTAYVIQGLLATGENVGSASWSVNGNIPMSFLLRSQRADGGFPWKPGQDSNALATEQTIPALLNQTFLLDNQPKQCSGSK
ncbi:hypothetical protein PN36_32415 [Candidatus Thiomargarita nelsonii]|uniref:Prenyltransferase alpha-alpha toroid domain-containing protein n=1 Tax=Candidatus Thiomargarita nelsonii TaxID=1003181 RepID=A0A0A6P418_9GAMM|nr:hypothetical protein PN36_32415 [Candidatus Thiomargarita nelsonii]